MNTYLFKYRRYNCSHIEEREERAHTAEDALVQFRVNVIDHPNNRTFDGFGKSGPSCITLLGMETRDG